ncbi:MAG TPA: hypothetical protein VL134_04550 [Leptolyngbya sp.]|nr:hypothetical protein [Leptolyngbya sp.]
MLSDKFIGGCNLLDECKLGVAALCQRLFERKRSCFGDPSQTRIHSTQTLIGLLKPETIALRPELIYLD